MAGLMSKKKSDWISSKHQKQFIISTINSDCTINQYLCLAMMLFRFKLLKILSCDKSQSKILRKSLAELMQIS